MKLLLLLLASSLAACAADPLDTSTDEGDLKCAPGECGGGGDDGGGGGVPSVDVNVSLSGTGFDVAWTDSVANARKWQLYRSTAYDRNCIRLTPPTGDALLATWTADPHGYSADHTGLLQDVTYCYTLSVTDSLGHITSNTECRLNPSGTVQSLFPVATQGRVQTSWYDSFLGEDTFTLKRVGPGTSTVTLDTEPGTFDVTCNGYYYSDGSIAPATSYRYQLWTHSPAGDILMEERNVTTLPGPPAAPSISGIAPTATTAVITYVDHAVGEDYFQLERCLNGTCNTVAILAARAGAGTSASYMDTGLAPSTYYLYRLTAWNAAGHASTTATTTTGAALPNLFPSIASGPAGLRSGHPSVAISHVCNTNSGYAAGGFDVLSVLKQAGTQVFANTQHVAGLASGGCIDIAATSGNLAVGAYQWTVYVDPAYAVPELSDLDNTQSTSFSVSP